MTGKVVNDKLYVTGPKVNEEATESFTECKIIWGEFMTGSLEF